MKLREKSKAKGSSENMKHPIGVTFNGAHNHSVIILSTINDMSTVSMGGERCQRLTVRDQGPEISGEHEQVIAPHSITRR